MSLTVSNLHKYFGGKPAVAGLDMSALPGHAFALLGGNGAGKTTTIRMILGLIAPDGGAILWKGTPLNRDRLRIGYLPEERGLYPKTGVAEQLIYFGRLHGMSTASARQSAARWLDRLGMTPHARRKVEELSKGNQQKIQLAAALINDPELVILDEPFSGLDPLNADLLQEVVAELVKTGKTLLFSSHQMDYVESLCEDIVILKNGETVLSGNLAAIRRSYGRTHLFVRAEKEISSLLTGPGILAVQQRIDGFAVQLADEQAARPVLRALVAADADIIRFELTEPTLRDIFIEKVGD